MSAEQQRIIMNYTTSPSLDELETMAMQMTEQLPDELIEYGENLVIQIEDFADETLLAENEIDDPFELPALFQSGREISPGVEKKDGSDENTLILYRRPILDLWCESGEDLSFVIRQIMVEEIARAHEFSDDDIETMIETHFQALL